MVTAMRQSRFEGTARYLWAKGWKLLLPGAVAIFVMELLIYLMPALGLGTAEQGVSTVFWYVSVCALILMYRAANVDARFLITRLTPRPSVYAGVVLEILTFTALGVLLAAAASAMTKLFGMHGVFYKVCGKGVGGIDGFYTRSSFELYHQMALINPDNPDELCAKLYQDTGIPVVLMDANDLQRDQLGKSPDFPLTDAQIQDAMADNPSGQGDELTPFILIRPLN